MAGQRGREQDPVRGEPFDDVPTWKKGNFRMESLAEFTTVTKPGDHLFSMDVSQGYRHMRLHPQMRDWFMFRLKTNGKTSVSLLALDGAYICFGLLRSLCPSCASFMT